MYFKQKLTYMVIGCLFTLAGYICATLGGSEFQPTNASAQDTNKQVIDEIVCRKLRIVNREGKTVVRLEAFHTGAAGLVLYNKEGKQVFWVSSSGDGSTLSMFNKDGEKTFWVWSSDVGGGHLAIYNNAGTRIFGVSSFDVVDDEFDVGGGILQLYTSEGDSLIKLNGKSGEVITRNKQGNETGRLPR